MECPRHAHKPPSPLLKTPPYPIPSILYFQTRPLPSLTLSTPPRNSTNILLYFWYRKQHPDEHHSTPDAHRSTERTCKFQNPPARFPHYMLTTTTGPGSRSTLLVPVQLPLRPTGVRLSDPAQLTPLTLFDAIMLALSNVFANLLSKPSPGQG